jgi:hypothetical protein
MTFSNIRYLIYGVVAGFLGCMLWISLHGTPDIVVMLNHNTTGGGVVVTPNLPFSTPIVLGHDNRLTPLDSRKSPAETTLLVRKKAGFMVHPKLYLVPLELGFGFGVFYVRELEANLAYFPKAEMVGVGVSYPIEVHWGYMHLENLELYLGWNFGVDKNSVAGGLALPF